MNLRKLKRNKKRTRQQAGPDTARSFFAIANEHKAHGRLPQAEAAYRKAVAANPDFAEAQNNLGNVLHGQGKLADALPCYQRACELMPTNPQPLYNYATGLYESGRPRQAVELLNKVIHLSPDNADAYSSLGVVHQALGNLDEAVSALQKAIRLKPDSVKSQRFLGLVLKDRGEIKEAINQFRKALACKPDDGLTWYLLTRYKRYQTKNDKDIKKILSILDRPGLAQDDAVFLHFGLGKIYDDLGLFKKAFAHYKEGNQKKRATLGRAGISTGIELQRILRVFQPSLFSRYHGAGSESEVPVFIIGMPRSGTTLVEQICASHPAVHGAGELKKVRELIERLPDSGEKARAYPECLLTLDQAKVKNLADSYVADLKSGLPEKIIRITDKMPTNFIELGLIRILFPRARIIHCCRNPLDTCLSNYFQNFEEGNECSFDLGELGLYYRKYQALMDFWAQNLPGEIFTIHYEELVADFPAKARELIDFLGLEWEECCLTFFKTQRMIHTSSDWQVRQPIYSRSAGRWKNYEPFLQPLKKALESTSRLV